MFIFLQDPEFNDIVDKSLPLISQISLDRMSVAEGSVEFNFTFMTVGLEKSTFSNLSDSLVFKLVNVEFPKLDQDFADDEIGIMVSSVPVLRLQGNPTMATK